MTRSPSTPASALNPRQRKFCDLVYAGLALEEAYVVAGYGSKRPALAAAKLAKTPKVQAYLTDLQSQAGPATVAFSRKELMHTLETVMVKGLEKGTLPPVVSAASLYAKICGFDDYEAAEGSAPGALNTTPEVHVHFLGTDNPDNEEDEH